MFVWWGRASSRSCITLKYFSSTPSAPRQPLRPWVSCRKMAPSAKRARQAIALDRGLRKLGKFPTWDARALGPHAARRQAAGELKVRGQPRPNFAEPPPVKKSFLTFATKTRPVEDLYFTVPRIKTKRVVVEKSEEDKLLAKDRLPTAEIMSNLFGGRLGLD